MDSAGKGFEVSRSLRIVTGTFAFTSILISAVSILRHFKNYRKPMDQRLIVRIQLLLPLFALSSWLNLRPNWLSDILDPVREIYEAFVIYTFFTLLTNILGGERDIIISTSGRAPKNHLFPLNYFCDKVDISDPYTFLAIKRGILQYTWLKPFLSVATVLLNSFGSFNHNTIGLTSGYMWIGLIYNISISISLYSLALFWYCLLDDLAPYRALPKFLCVKAIIFFSYWQGFAMGVLVYLGLIPETGDGENNSIARVIQNSLMCIEMLGFAVGHWYAFSYHDYATAKLIGFARLPVYYAMRDSFGVVDLWIDFKSTFYGQSYGYRQFDSVEDVLSHPESRSRRARIEAGLRYRSDGRSKYWLPKSTLAKVKAEGLIDQAHLLHGEHATYTYGSMAPSSGETSPVLDVMRSSPSSSSEALVAGDGDFWDAAEMAQDEELYAQAAKLKYGDYNYPVITVRESIEYRPLMNDQAKRNAHNEELRHMYDTYVGPESDDDENDFFA